MDSKDFTAVPPPPSPSSQFSSAALSSPYLNFDPNLITPGYNSSEYIFADGGANRHSRGRFDLAFSQIGVSVMSGAALGGVRGFINGYKNTALAAPTAEQVAWSVRRSQILNYITKTGANTANAFGIVALIYSAIGVALGHLNESNDDINTITAATTTGLLYRGLGTPKAKTAEAAAMLKTLPAWQIRLRRSAVGGAIGFGISALYVIATNSEKYLK